MSGSSFDTDVLVIGSGFGGSVAALRFAEAGQQVVVLERGPWVRREDFQFDADAFWNPRRHRFGMNDLRPRGRNVIPWLGAGVGGGSHVYAATLKRRDAFSGFPAAITPDEMDRFYSRAEEMMEATRYPDYPPYGDIKPTQLLYRAGIEMKRCHPELVQEHGPINLGIAFAPPEGEPGAEFINRHGAQQRYSNPAEQSLLGGDIDAKNSLDRNYLFAAQQHGAEVRPLCRADRIEPLAGGGYRVHYRRYVLEPSRMRRVLRNWLPGLFPPRDETGELTTRRLVVAAGAIGSSELLLRNRDVHATLTELSPALGGRYTSNGDYLSLMLPFRGVFVSWTGVLLVVTGLVRASWWLAAAGAIAYGVGLWRSRGAFDPDIGTTNSDYIKFRARDGSSQGAYVESGRYPTPLRGSIAMVMSIVGLYRPRRYAGIIHVTNWLRRWVPPFELIGRSWPIPLLKMGRDDATGTFRLNRHGRAVIDYDFAANRDFYRWLNSLGRKVSKSVGAWWLPNFPAALLKRIEVPHNQGGAPMGADSDSGVVDHAGRVFGYRDLMVLDGSVIPVSPGPNPALTILALAERAMEHALAQIDSGGEIYPET